MSPTIFAYRRKSRKYHGFDLKPGHYYGVDERGRFVCTLRCLDEKTLKRAQSYLLHIQYGTLDVPLEMGYKCVSDAATIRIYRLDIERGWISGWEKSATTSACIQRALEDGWKLCASVNWEDSPRTLLAEVPTATTKWCSAIPGYSLMS